MSLQAASRYIPSLSMLRLDVSPDDAETTLLHVKQKWNHELPLATMWLGRCDLLFSSHSNALALWACFARLVDLTIWDCDALVYWPENVFQVLVSLRELSIRGCSKLTGRTQASGEQSAPGRDGLLPHLESLGIYDCASLVEEDTRLARGEGVVQLDTSSSIPGSSSREATTSTAVLKLSSAANHRFLPRLESLDIWHCYGLSEVANLPPSIKTLGIYYCGNLQSLSGQLGDIQKLTIDSCRQLESLDSCLGELRSLEELELYGCKSLVSLPDGPQAYSSLRVLWITHCDGVKSLPPSLQSRLGCLEEKVLDARYEDLPEPKTRKCAMRSLACLK
ncbi:disease resistance protein TAO1-like [Panicum virgatum]|uniref:disease resistance protein TAO1-like n=1 Tax=Panicum virgatum TaxID=38727 RepID=UPI0019D586B2|nr:disease resistance protein TAO1-like [Panicum virgatum]